MSSPLQTVISYIQLKDYLFFVTATAVGYDYILTFTREIEYIWDKPWTRVSTLFVLARYAGLCAALTLSIWGSSLLPGLAKMYASIFRLFSSALITVRLVFTCRCSAFLLTGEWSLWIFVCAADLMMLLRVRALYYRSRIVACILFSLYAMQVVSLLAYFIVLSVRMGSNKIYTAQVSQFSFCVATDFFSGSFWIQALPSAFQLALGALMCLLTAIQILTESIQMYKTTKCFQLNRYLKHIVGEGMLYFIVILTFAILSMLIESRMNTTDAQFFLLIAVVQLVPPITLIPRFILSLRELYARDIRGRQGGGIDTALLSPSEFSHGAIQSQFIFANPGQDEGNSERADNGTRENLALGAIVSERAGSPSHT